MVRNWPLRAFCGLTCLLWAQFSSVKVYSYWWWHYLSPNSPTVQCVSIAMYIAPLHFVGSSNLCFCQSDPHRPTTSRKPDQSCSPELQSQSWGAKTGEKNTNHLFMPIKFWKLKAIIINPNFCKRCINVSCVSYLLF